MGRGRRVFTSLSIAGCCRRRGAEVVAIEMDIIRLVLIGVFVCFRPMCFAYVLELL